jgi:hypothetical protein
MMTSGTDGTRNRVSIVRTGTKNGASGDAHTIAMMKLTIGIYCHLRISGLARSLVVPQVFGVGQQHETTLVVL